MLWNRKVWLPRLVLNVETACGGHELGLYGMSCCEILLLLNMANMDCLLCRRLYIVFSRVSISDTVKSSKGGAQPMFA